MALATIDKDKLEHEIEIKSAEVDAMKRTGKDLNSAMHYIQALAEHNPS